MRILYILLIIYILYKVFFNFILPLVVRHLFQKAANNMNGEFGQFQQQSPPRRQGEVRIEDPGTSTAKKKHFSSNDVEDVDFIEVK